MRTRKSLKKNHFSSETTYRKKKFTQCAIEKSFESPFEAIDIIIKTLTIWLISYSTLGMWLYLNHHNATILIGDALGSISILITTIISSLFITAASIASLIMPGIIKKYLNSEITHQNKPPNNPPTNKPHNLNYFLILVLLASTSETLPYWTTSLLIFIFSSLHIYKHAITPTISPSKTTPKLHDFIFHDGFLLYITASTNLLITLFQSNHNFYLFLIQTFAISLAIEIKISNNQSAKEILTNSLCSCLSALCVMLPVYIALMLTIELGYQKVDVPSIVIIGAIITITSLANSQHNHFTKKPIILLLLLCLTYTTPFLYGKGLNFLGIGGFYIRTAKSSCKQFAILKIGENIYFRTSSGIQISKLDQISTINMGKFVECSTIRK